MAAEELSFVPTPFVYAPNIFTEHDYLLEAMQFDRETTEWETELAAEEAASLGRSLSSNSLVVSDSPLRPFAEQFDALLLYLQRKAVPLRDCHPVRAPFSKKRPIQEGDDVNIFKLSRHVHLNGAVGQVLQFDDAKQRWIVQLPLGESVLIKDSNVGIASYGEILAFLRMDNCQVCKIGDAFHYDAVRPYCETPPRQI
jgi:hypothetical protein